MMTKTLRVIFFLCNLFGMLPIVLAAFNINKAFVQAHIYFFIIPLGIGVIGSFLLPKYESWKNEREMRQMGENR